MWIALALPLLVLPALLAFSRFEQVMLAAPRARPAAQARRDDQASPAGERSITTG